MRTFRFLFSVTAAFYACVLFNPLHAQWIRIHGLENTFITNWLAHDSVTYAAGHWSGLFRSFDEGVTWTPIPISNRQYDTITSLTATANYLFAGSDGWGVHRSSNRGDTWEPVSNGMFPVHGVTAVLATDNSVYAGTHSGIYWSTDEGESWINTTAGSQLIIREMVTGGGSIFAITDLQRGVYRSPTDHPAWSFVGLTGTWGNSLAAIDTNIFAATSTGVYLYTGSDSTWAPRNNGLGSLWSYAITAVHGTLFVGTFSGVYRSTDLGYTWEQANDPVFFGRSIRAMISSKENLLTATDDGCWRRPLAEVLTNIDELEPDFLLRNFFLHQNYPNPFNPATEIRYQMSEASHVTLMVYDVLGREVATLVNGEREAGTHRVRWEAAGLPSGVYLCRLKASGFVETKKMALVR